MRLRPTTGAGIAWSVLLAFLAAALVPREAWYVHEHAADHGGRHAHGWDGTRVAGRHADGQAHDRADADPGGGAWWADQLSHRHAGGHDHHHPEGARHQHGTRHHHPEAGHPARHDDAKHGHDAVAAERAHALDDPAPAPHANERPRSTSLASARGAGALHGHWQSPFQLAARATSPRTAARVTVARAPAAAIPAPRAACGPSRQARAPPRAVSV